MRVLVCGGRDYKNSQWVWKFLDTFHADTPITCLIEGGARGADFFARQWAIHNKVDGESYYADWNTFGPAAGTVRNSRMLRDGKPDVVIAFPGGAGTNNMIYQAIKNGVSVINA